MRGSIFSALCLSVATMVAPAAMAGDWDYKLGVTGFLPTQDLNADWPTDTTSDDYDWDNFSFGITSEAWNGRFGMIGDLLYADTEGTGSSAGTDIQSNVSLTSLGAYGAYRLYDGRSASIDALGGVRLQNVDIDYYAPDFGALDGVSETWVEPVIGARGQIGHDDGFFARAAFDVGGFVNDAETWQAKGTVGYGFDNGWSAEAGWRYIDMKVPTAGTSTDLELSGPVFGVAYRF